MCSWGFGNKEQETVIKKEAAPVFEATSVKKREPDLLGLSYQHVVIVCRY